MAQEGHAKSRRLNNHLTSKMKTLDNDRETELGITPTKRVNVTYTTSHRPA